VAERAIFVTTDDTIAPQLSRRKINSALLIEGDSTKHSQIDIAGRGEITRRSSIRVRTGHRRQFGQ
jgi:hypothetical protein